MPMEIIYGQDRLVHEGSLHRSTNAEVLATLFLTTFCSACPCAICAVPTCVQVCCATNCCLPNLDHTLRTM